MITETEVLKQAEDSPILQGRDCPKEEITLSLAQEFHSREGGRDAVSGNVDSEWK